jgi:hypothetical protein
MADLSIKIDGQKVAVQIAEITRNLDRLFSNKAMFGKIVDAINPVIVEVMQEYDPAHYITRKAAYGKTFFTARQRRYFFAVILPRGLPYQRTGAMARAWHVEGKGVNSKVTNTTAAAFFTQDNSGQSRHETLVGWRTTEQRIRFAEQKYVDAAKEAARKAVLEFYNNS